VPAATETASTPARRNQPATARLRLPDWQMTYTLHREHPGQARGNQDGSMVVPLPIGEPDHLRRLDLIAAETAHRKTKAHPPRSADDRATAVARDRRRSGQG
jgi:hypothetical protein